MNEKAVIAFMAHPDDAEISMGGTLARFADRGYEVHIGMASVPDNREMRLAEAEKGAAILGAKLHLIDPLQSSGTWQIEDIPVYKLVGALDALYRQINARIVFAHWNGDTHYDHVLLSRATISMSRRLGVDIYMCEQPNQYAPYVSPPDLNTYVDVTQYMEQRIASIRAHASQVAGRPYEEHVRARARFYGERIGCEYAEAFHCVAQRLKIG